MSDTPNINDFEEIVEEPSSQDFEPLEEETPIADKLEGAAGGILEGAGEVVQAGLDTGMTALISGALFSEGKVTSDQASKATGDDYWNNRRNANIAVNKMKGKAPAIAATTDFATTVAGHYATGNAIGATTRWGKVATVFAQGALSGATRSNSDTAAEMAVDALGGGAMSLIVPGGLKAGASVVRGVGGAIAKRVPFEKAWSAMKSSTKQIALGFTNATRRKNLSEFLEKTGQDEDKFLNWAINLKKGKNYVFNASSSMKEMQKIVGHKAANSLKSLQKHAAKNDLQVNTQSVYDGTLRILRKVMKEGSEGLKIEAKAYYDDLLKLTHVMETTGGLSAPFPTTLKPMMQASDAISFLGNIAKNGFKGSKTEVRAEIRNLLADFPQLLEKSGKLDPKVVSSFARKTANYGNLSTLNRMAKLRGLDGTDGIGTKVKHLIGVRGALVAAGTARAIGNGPAVVLGAAANSALQSKKLDTVAAVQLRELSRGTSKYPNHPMWMALTTAAESTTEYWRTALNGTLSKLALKENRVARNMESFKHRGRDIASVIELEEGPEAADAFSNALENAPDDEKEKIIGELVASLDSRYDDYIEPGIGFNGKVHTQIEKDTLQKNLNERVDAPLQYKLMAGKELQEKGIIPSPPEEYIQAQDMLKHKQLRIDKHMSKLDKRY